YLTFLLMAFAASAIYTLSLHDALPISLHDIREIVEKKLTQMLNNNPARMDYYRRYQEIIADYNREKDRTTVEQTFAALVALVERSEEHTSELQSRGHLVCRLLLEKKKR